MRETRHDTNECPHQYQEQSEEQVCGLWESNNHRPKANSNQSFNQQNPQQQFHNQGQAFHNNNVNPRQKYNNPQQNFHQPQNFNNHSNPNSHQNINPNPPIQNQMSTEELTRTLTSNVTTMSSNVNAIQGHMTTIQATVTNLEAQVGKLSQAMTRIEAKSATNPPSQPTQHPNVSAIVTRSGKEMEIMVKDKGKDAKKATDDKFESVGRSDENMSNEVEIKPVEIEDEKEEEEPQIPPIGSLVYEPRAPFPLALKETKKLEHDRDIYETFRRCEVNIPLLDLLNSVPKYAKFLMRFAP